MARANSSATLPTCAATTNATSITTVPADLHAIIATNTTASIKYLKLYNKASSPTVGTDIPVLCIALQINNLPTVVNIPEGFYFNSGLAYAITGAAANTDTTALAAGNVVGLNFIYYS
jgi:hypothetical protein